MLAASIFHYGTYRIPEVKEALQTRGLPDAAYFFFGLSAYSDE